MAESDPEFQNEDIIVDESSDSDAEEVNASQLKSVLKKPLEPVEPEIRPELPEQPGIYFNRPTRDADVPDPNSVDFSTMTPLSPDIIARQATIK
jgi:translation initiation factor 2 subunit 3